MTPKVVKAAEYYGAAASLLGAPKFSIKCGNCGFSWRERIPHVDNPRLLCRVCGVLNQLDVVWAK